MDLGSDSAYLKPSPQLPIELDLKKRAFETKIRTIWLVLLRILGQLAKGHREEA